MIDPQREPGYPASPSSRKAPTAAPRAVRGAEVKTNAVVNLDAECKVTQLNEELQSLVRAIRARVSL